MSDTIAVQESSARQAQWLWPCGILLIAVAARILFFRGAMGTDEDVYLAQARDLLNGTIDHSQYIGALRYGVNLIQALSLLLFGNGYAGADGVYFLCSIGGVGLAYYFANHIWGQRAAIWAGLSLSFLPLDVALAGGLNPDCYIGFMIAAAFVLFFLGEERDSRLAYLASGLLTGWVFLIKEEVIVFGLAFVAIAALQRRWRSGYWWFAAGGIAGLVVNLIAFGLVYGNPLYIFQILVSKVHFASSSVLVDTRPWTYFLWLFLKVYHTGLLGWFAAGGAIFALRSRHAGTRFVLVWGISLLAIFSFLPFTLHPLSFMPKQTNYMEIFLFPLVLLCGYFLSRLGPKLALVLGAGMILFGVVFSAMEQQVISVATADGPAAADFADAHAALPVFGPWSSSKASTLRRLLNGNLDSGRFIWLVGELPKRSFGPGPADQVVGYVIRDPQMQHWDPWYQQMAIPQAIRGCLQPVATLQPTADMGYGRNVVGAIRQLARWAPGPIGRHILGATDRVWQVAPAQAYALTRACAARMQAGAPAQ